DAVDVAADRAALGPREVDPARGLVHTVHGACLPLPVRHLADERAVGAIVIDVPEAGTVAGPQERAVFQPPGTAGIVHPRLAGFLDHRAQRLIPAREVEVEPGLLAVLDLEDDVPAVGRPAHVADQVLAPVPGGVDPAWRAAGGGDHPEAHGRVGIARLGIRVDLGLRVVRYVVHDRVARHCLLTELQEGDPPGVR